MRCAKPGWIRSSARQEIKVNLGVNANLALARLQTMNANGADWDIVDLTAAEYTVAVRENMLLPIAGHVDTSGVYPDYVKSHGFFYGLFVYVMGWDRRVIPQADGPKTWADFFDRQKYPGKRTLQTVRTNGNSIEAALLADGVPIDKLYPLDIERALRVFDTRLGKENIIWAQTNQEPVQYLMSGETHLAGIFTTRVLIANRGGAQIGFNINQGISNGDLLTVIKNAKNKDEAFAFMNFVATRPDRGAQMMALAAVEVPLRDAAALIPKDAEDAKEGLAGNPAMKGKILISDTDYWAQNLERVATRFKEWQLS